jgi:hypothetical protein
MKLTKDQIREMYQAIISQDKTFIRLFAEVAVEEALETKADMWAEARIDMPDLPPPTIFDGKVMASAFVTDMLKDFGDDFRAEVAEMECDVRHELRIHVTYGA